MQNTIDFLLSKDSDPWVRYRTKIDLLDEKVESLSNIKNEILKSGQIINLINEVASYPWIVLNSHKSAAHPIHKLAFLADIGLKHNDYRIEEVINNIFKNISVEGVFQSLMNIPKSFGGTGTDVYCWASCDAPLLSYSLVKFGLEDDEKVIKCLNYLISTIYDNGFRCTNSPDLGKFRGPGKKDDPCPYVNLIMLKLLGLNKKQWDSNEVAISVNTLLNLWEESKVNHPYMFYMGNDFRKLKAPQVWYDIVNVLDVISVFPFTKKDKRAIEMLVLINSKKNENELFTPESVWLSWKDWEFGQKKSLRTG